MENSGKKMLGGLLLALALLVLGQPALAAASSVNVVIIGGSQLDTGYPCGYGYQAANVMGYTGGGCLTVNETAPGFGSFAFSAMHPVNVSAASLAAYDTAVLNVASWAMGCNMNTLTAQQKADLVAFAAGGKKLIIFDSECYPGPIDYSWMPYPFSTANPGAMGALGTLTIVEENTLSSNDPLSPYFINASYLSNFTDAVGDMNVMTTYDPNWCVDMSGTNAIGKTGPVHTYAKTGADVGLFIYNGLDQDYQYMGDQNMVEIWLQELQQAFNPSNLPCGVTVVGITLDPMDATNEVGEKHTVVATLKDLLGNPQPGILVDFSVITGPNSPLAGSATTNASGQASFTYAGTGGVGIDQIKACFTDQAGQVVCSQVAEKEWTVPPTGSISGAKFNDLNENGVRDSGEPGLAGWTITLTAADGTVSTALTDGSGNYKFGGVIPGTYVVGEVVQPGWVQTYPATGTYTVNLAAGANETGRDFGNYRIEGRMTGGGSVFTKDGTRVTHGFELNCDASKGPDNLEVNWGKGNKFHLEALKDAYCMDDAAIEPNPPKAGFDTYVGVGAGRYNGVSGAMAKWVFTDAGEPGKKDMVRLVVVDVNGNVVLSVSGKLNSGNQQAHEE